MTVIHVAQQQRKQCEKDRAVPTAPVTARTVTHPPPSLLACFRSNTVRGIINIVRSAADVVIRARRYSATALEKECTISSKQR